MARHCPKCFLCISCLFFAKSTWGSCYDFRMTSEVAEVRDRWAELDSKILTFTSDQLIHVHKIQRLFQILAYESIFMTFKHSLAMRMGRVNWNVLPQSWALKGQGMMRVPFLCSSGLQEERFSRSIPPLYLFYPREGGMDEFGTFVKSK